MDGKLLFITPLFPSSKDEDTIVPFIFQFTEQFSQKYPSIEIHILAINYPLEKGIYMINNSTIYAMGGGFNKGLFSFVRFFKSLRKALSLYKKHRYTGVLSFWYGTSAIIGNILKSRFKVTHKTWLQGQDVKRNNWYLKWLAPKGENLITISKNQQRLLFENHRIHTNHIANVCVDENDFPELNKESRTIDIIGVGNLGPIKNYSKFIDVISQVHKKIPELKVVICGDGEEKEELQKKINTLSLHNTIELLGYVSNRKVKELLNTTSVFLHTSIFEGNPMVLQEALFSGCNVVSTFNIEEESNAIQHFYCANETAALSEKTIELLTNPLVTTSRVHHFKMEDTIKTIHALLSDNTLKAS
ncbi:glycosyltransferase [Flavobacteriaceae bacterium S356]|uniref:Glycosyltransferase n=1 Tax=Asprobacillus argus TaxID=3076534 RepID=A0ABU3LH47_9FLAO|nr:glycosyltransferase [Flavobacteriaceae bacterium S356]